LKDWEKQRTVFAFMFYAVLIVISTSIVLSIIFLSGGVNIVDTTTVNIYFRDMELGVDYENR